MTDRLIVGQVDGCDPMGGEEDAVPAVGAQRPDGQTLAEEGLRDFPRPTFEADVGLTYALVVETVRTISCWCAGRMPCGTDGLRRTGSSAFADG